MNFECYNSGVILLVISDNPRSIVIIMIMIIIIIIIIVFVVIKHSIPAKLSMSPALTFGVLTNQLRFT